MNIFVDMDLINDLTVKTADWTCPYVENRFERFIIESFRNVDEVKKMMEENRLLSGKDRYTLPLWQNLEAIVYGTRILNNGRYFTPGEYCPVQLSDLRDLDFNLLSDPMIQAVIEVIRSCSEQARQEDSCYEILLEAESPFSILAAIINPFELYACSEEEGDLLKEILHKIADASADYIRSCVDAGCRIVSMADPTGTLDLVGESYYKEFCGEAAIYMLKKCQPFLDHAIVHICKKMSQSLLISRMATAERYQVKKYQRKAAGKVQSIRGIMDILSVMAEDESIHFTGMNCIHDPAYDYNQAVKLVPHL